MRAQITKEEALDLSAKWLKIDIASLNEITTFPLEEGKRRLIELKSLAKKNYKLAALELHPDRTNNDLIKSEIFTKLGYVMQEIESLELHIKPRPVTQFIQINYGFNSGTTSTTTAGFNGVNIVIDTNGNMKVV